MTPFAFNQVYPFCSSPPLTPSKIKQCVQNLWENEKFLFSEHLAMVFPGESNITFRSGDEWFFENFGSCKMLVKFQGSLSLFFF